MRTAGAVPARIAVAWCAQVVLLGFGLARDAPLWALGTLAVGCVAVPVALALERTAGRKRSRPVRRPVPAAPDGTEHNAAAQTAGPS